MKLRTLLEEIVLGAVAFLGICLITCVFLSLANRLRHMARLAREHFEPRFPPISDAEFLARCPEGTNPEVALKVRRIVADSTGFEYDRLYPSTRFLDLEAY